MGRHSDGRAAGPPTLPPLSLVVALAAAIVVTATILVLVAVTHRGSDRPVRPITDLKPSPSLLLSPTPASTRSAGQ
jgi:hypothetical protein